MTVQLTAKLTKSPGLFFRRKFDAVDAALAGGVLDAAIYQEGILRRVVVRETRDGTGRLPRSFKARMLSGSGRVSAGVLSSLEYAAIQDVGGVIKPKTQKNLAIPLKRLPAGKWPRDFGDQLTLIRSRKGNLILAKIRRGRIDPYFVLKPSVRIPGKQYLAQAQDEGADGVAERLGNKVSAALVRSRDE